MIADEHQYRVSQERLHALLHDRATLDTQLRDDAVKHEWVVGGLDLVIADARSEIAEYESRQGDGPAELEMADLGALPATLVQARLAAGLTQEELAGLLDVPLQQVRQDEQGGYAEASLARIRRILDALGVEYRRPLALAVPTKRP